MSRSQCATLETEANRHAPYEDNQFDAVMCQTVLTYVRDAEAVVREMARVLKREAGAGTPEPPVAWHGEVEHIQSGRRWAFGTVDELLAFLRKQADGSEVSGRRFR